MGVAASGGIDSSSIAVAMRELVGDRLDLHTFSYVSDDPRLSEERWIRTVTSAVSASAHAFTPEPGEIVSGLDAAVGWHEEPLESMTVFVQTRLARLAAEQWVKVVLHGQGADELLGGYSTALTPRFASLVRSERFVGEARFLRALSRQPLRGSVRQIALQEGLVLPPPLRAPLRRALAAEPPFPAWLNGRWFEAAGVATHRPTPDDGFGLLHGRLLLDLTETRLPMLLRCEDRNWMAHSIECRVPFLSTRLADFLLALPEHYLVAADGTRKAVFRAAMRGLVPDEILDRRDQVGYLAPERLWLIGLRRWVGNTPSSPAAERVRALDLLAVRRDWEAAADGAPAQVQGRFWRSLNLVYRAGHFDVSF